jgi:hypothetical protein
VGRLLSSPRLRRRRQVSPRQDPFHTSIAGGDYGLKNDYYGDTIRLQVMLTVAGDWWAP